MRRSVHCLFLVGLMVVGSGCLSNRLDGPIHSADQPPFIRADQDSGAPALDVVHRVVLIGDAGLYLEGDPTLDALGQWTADAPTSSVLFLGDNIYNDGLREEDREEAERILSQQLEATNARKIFIPGNHDWGMNPKHMNSQAILNQQAFIDDWPAGNAEFAPRDGCMGPDLRVLRESDDDHKGVIFIAIDPTPWINPHLREACSTGETPESHLAEVEALLARHTDDFVIVASHYPMLTGGPHGGLTYGFLGDMIVGLVAWSFGGLGNTYEPAYADWITQAQAVFRRYPPLVYAAGHDHNLQVLEAGAVAGAYVVSGAGAPERVSTVTDLPESLFAHAAPGFVVLDFGLSDGEQSAVLRVIENGSSVPVFEMPLH